MGAGSPDGVPANEFADDDSFEQEDYPDTVMLAPGEFIEESAEPAGFSDVNDSDDGEDESLTVATELAIDRATAAVLATDVDCPAPSKPLSDTIAVTVAAQHHQAHAGLAAIRSLIRGSRYVTWVFTGDNIVQGAYYTQGARSCVEIFAERVRAELRRAGDAVINTGVAGDTATQLLRTLQRRATRYRPEVIGISVGINDAKWGPAGRSDFRRDVREILDRVRTEGSIPLLILPHPIYAPTASNRTDLSTYVQILREEAARDEVPCIDQWNYWRENFSDPEEIRARLGDARIQLGAAGHQDLAALIFRTLEIYDPNSPACLGLK